ncbi:MAG TPA: S9 family peptidase [Acidobacteriaceae bacterium]|nr:S9 family peptidase [Acidobacteriaceae bacterium]
MPQILSSATSIQPPVARREPTPTTLHGITLQDDFRWMRDKESPEVLAYLEAENAYTASVMAPTTDLQAKLYAEMLSHIKETDESVPYRLGAWFYSTRTLEGSQYAIHCRRPAANPDLNSPFDPTQPEQIILDVNQLSEGHPFMSLGSLAVSPDGNLLAYSTDSTGFRQYTLHIRRYDPALRTWTDLPDTAERTGSLAWAADSRTLFYSTEDETTKRQDKIFRHTLGAPTSEDTLVLHEEDERFNVGIGRTRDGRFLMIEAGSHTTNEYRFLDSSTPTAAFALIAERQDEQEYYPEHRWSEDTGSLFYIRTNDTGKNFRVVTAPVVSPSRDHWRELIPLDPSHPLEDFDLFATFAVTTRRKLGLPTLEVLRFTDPSNAIPTLTPPTPITFPEPTYSAAPHVNRIFTTSTFRYSYQSLVSPPSVYEYNVAQPDFTTPIGQSKLLKQQEVPGGFDPALYASERLWIEAPAGDQPEVPASHETPHHYDTTRPQTVPVPVSIVYRRDLFHRDGTNPLYIYGYGSYGYPLPVGFSPSRLSLLDRGVVMVYAHIRGGGELGDAWHDAGKMQLKRNTFTDFIAATEHLTAKKYGDPTRVAIEGGSAGGLLMGAVTNMRPDLFRVVLSHVPFVDIMNTMLDATLPLTVAEYEEWGNPNEPEAFRTMLAYSPYDNVDNLESLANAPIPAILVKTSLNDSQVMYWEPAKYVARLRTIKQNSTPLLLHINMDAGHGGASGRYDYLKEIAFDYAFLLTQLGIVTSL